MVNELQHGLPARSMNIIQILDQESQLLVKPIFSLWKVHQELKENTPGKISDSSSLIGDHNGSNMVGNVVHLWNDDSASDDSLQEVERDALTIWLFEVGFQSRQEIGNHGLLHLRALSLSKSGGEEL